jgi:hypothetical protein
MDDDQGSRASKANGHQDTPAPPQNLGILFVAAALALAFVLSLVALIGYFALSMGGAPAPTNRTARRPAPVSGQL